MADYDAQPGRKPPPEPELSPAQLQADELDLTAGLTGLARSVAGAYSIDEMLGQVAQFAVQSIPGADGAGVTMIHPGHQDPRIQALARWPPSSFAPSTFCSTRRCTRDRASAACNPGALRSAAHWAVTGAGRISVMPGWRVWVCIRCWPSR